MIFILLIVDFAQSRIHTFFFMRLLVTRQILVNYFYKETVTITETVHIKVYNLQSNIHLHKFAVGEKYRTHFE